MSFPSSTLSKNIPQDNVLRAREHPVEEPNVIHNESLLWIYRKTFSIVPPLNTSESES